MNAAAWPGRFATSAATLGDEKLVIAAGDTGDTLLSDVWASPDGGVTWTLVMEHAVWEARANGLLVEANDTAYLVGGSTAEGTTDRWSSADLGVTWQAAPAAAPLAGILGGGLVHLTGGELLVVGGNRSGAVESFVLSSPDAGRTWESVAAAGGGAFPWAARSFPL